MVEILPTGVVPFIPPLWTGSIRDKEIVRQSELRALTVFPHRQGKHFSFVVSLFASFRSPICIFPLMFSTVGVWIFLNT